jgi:hypothetical protein
VNAVPACGSAVKKVALRTVAVIGLACLFFGACGGKTVGRGSADDGGSCVNVDLSSYDQSCERASDCVFIQSGEVCSGQCRCGNSVVNASAEARYRSAIAGVNVKTTACFCIDRGPPRCVQNHCTLCGSGPGQPAGCGDGGARVYNP